MRHHHITKVLYIFLVGVFIVGGAVMGAYSQAPRANAALFTPYGGSVVSVVIQPLNVACPEYSVIANADPTSGPTIFAVFIPPTPVAPTYDFNNLFIPSTPVLGGYVPVDDPACAPGLPAFPLFYNMPDGPFYLTGTGAF